MPTDAAITLSYPEPDIAVLTLDVPNKGANVLSRPVLEEFNRSFDLVAKRSGLAGLVIRSGKPGTFIAGADIREFAASIDASQAEIVEMCTLGRKLFQRLSQMPFVTVAAIGGICVGGGAELAIWCDRRVMADDSKTHYGFPEVKLGLFPGWGGTARTPRIVGLGNAVELVTGGESIDGRHAATMGLASDVVPAARLQEAAMALIRAEQQSGPWRRDRERWAGPIETNETELVFLGATASAYIQQQTKGHYPAPLAALELMLSAAGQDIESACQAEAEGMAKLFGTPVNRSLINIFLLTDRNKKDSGIDGPAVKPQPIESVSVFGAGIMGSGIAGACLKRGLAVALSDAQPAALERGVKGILEEVSYNKAVKGPDVQKALDFAPRLNATTADAELAAADLVIEAVVENPKVKKELYARIERQLRPTAILASNTSTIPIGTLAEGLARPERFVGIHFFNPVRKMPLVEVIRGPKTSDETVAAAVAFAKAIGKSPIVVYDGPGFLVNRILFPYLNEALELIADGVPIEAIDKAAKAFGMPMGPITLYDVVGLDTALYAGAVMHEAFPDRCLASPLLQAMVQAGRLGEKSGAGFFSHKDKKKRGQPDPTLAPLIQPHLRAARKLTPEEITERLFLPMLLEATRIIEEKKVRDPRDVDLGLIFGIGFPPFKGGLLHWADQVGAGRIVEMLKPYEGLGPRYQATPLLKEMARTGKRFYTMGETR
jgi:3-hydroxyacyl-CoA dehydrogenase/enoyl-CoA hydratase/3-hydroxybutyryl-CoA epimerase/3-hydroxyacyl-CoA dehydrogenase/enoyl-CoA hydratase/3-hydroxybutyryl-CoA epimerase/enoyl-CoA isomerase